MTESERQRRLKRKQDYFKSFDLLTTEDDDETDAGRRASMLCLAGVRALPKSITAEDRSGGSDSLPPLSAETYVAKLARTARETLHVPPSTVGAVSSLKGSAFPGGSRAILVQDSLSSPTVLQTSSKRKGDAKINLVPEGQRIFHDLRFYFFPPGDKHPARRMRIVKAISFGATWCKDWDHNVTHVIVDKDIEYGLLLKYLKMDALPTTVVLVSENYPSECICYRTMLDANQQQFLVKGFTPSTMLSKPSIGFPSSNESNISLKLKSARKAVITRQWGTPATDVG